MNVQLIFNEQQVKDLCPISKNIDGSYIAAAMFEAQEIDLEGILGTCLLSALKARETADLHDEPYETLKAVCVPYLAYRTAARLIPKVAVKIANAGAIRNTDDKYMPVSKEEADSLAENYTASADYFCIKLQNYLLANEDAFPELTPCQCEAIRANLYSAASCGIWLGGPRGMKL